MFGAIPFSCKKDLLTYKNLQKIYTYYTTRTTIGWQHNVKRLY